MLQQQAAVPAKEEAAIVALPAAPVAGEESSVPCRRIVVAGIMRATKAPVRHSTELSGDKTSTVQPVRIPNRAMHTGWYPAA